MFIRMCGVLQLERLYSGFGNLVNNTILMKSLTEKKFWCGKYWRFVMISSKFVIILCHQNNLLYSICSHFCCHFCGYIQTAGKNPSAFNFTQPDMRKHLHQCLSHNCHFQHRDLGEKIKRQHVLAFQYQYTVIVGCQRPFLTFHKSNSMAAI